MTTIDIPHEFTAIEQRSAALDAQLDSLLDQVIALDPHAPGATATLSELGAELNRNTAERKQLVADCTRVFRQISSQKGAG